MLSAIGRINVDQNSERIVVDISDDFVAYYKWFLAKEKWLKLHAPAYGSHITIANSKLYHNINYILAAKKFHGVQIPFSYSNNLIRGGQTKGFTMYYLEVFSEDITRIKAELKIKDGPNYRGLHVTLGNLNKNGQVTMTYWPDTIQIKI